MSIVQKLRQLIDDPMLRNMVVHGATALIIKNTFGGLQLHHVCGDRKCAEPS